MLWYTAAALQRHEMTALLLCITAAASGCSLRNYALRATADAISATGSGAGSYAEDDDPELVRAAAPFGLKTMEQLLFAVPDHRQLPVALAGGFTQYSYAFVQQDADRAEDQDVGAAEVQQLRARRLYLRGRDHALHGLDRRYPGLRKVVLGGDRARRDAAVQQAKKEDVPLLYWAAASWALAVSTAKDNARLIGDLPAVEALMGRALALDETWDEGAIHEFYVSYDASRSKEAGGGPERARQHLDRAMQLNQGHRLGALVSYAEGVLVQKQDRAAFARTLRQVLAADVHRDEEGWRKNRLANIIAQKRARWLLAREADLFA